MYNNIHESPKMLSRVEDRISFLYIEKAKIEQTEYGIKLIQGTTHIEIPIATVLCLLLGPGTSITHRAIENIAYAGCSVVWCGEDGFSFYAAGHPLTKSAKNILKQIKAHENTQAHIDIIRKMYTIRYPGTHVKTKSLQVLRGEEGKKVKELYEKLAQKYKIEWNGREYKPNDFENQNAINKNLTYANQILYALIKSVIVAIGYDPAIGFVHTGNMDSFVYDIADLYKETFTIPIAFECAQNENFNKTEIRMKMKQYIIQNHWMKQVVKDICNIFSTSTNLPNDDILLLWDNKKNYLKSGKNYHEK